MAAPRLSGLKRNYPSQILVRETKLSVVAVKNSKYSLQENISIDRQTEPLVTLNTSVACCAPR